MSLSNTSCRDLVSSRTWSSEVGGSGNSSHLLSSEHAQNRFYPWVISFLFMVSPSRCSKGTHHGDQWRHIYRSLQHMTLTRGTEWFLVVDLTSSYVLLKREVNRHSHVFPQCRSMSLSNTSCHDLVSSRTWSSEVGGSGTSSHLIYQHNSFMAEHSLYSSSYTSCSWDIAMERVETTRQRKYFLEDMHRIASTHGSSLFCLWFRHQGVPKRHMYRWLEHTFFSDLHHR